MADFNTLVPTPHYAAPLVDFTPLAKLPEQYFQGLQNKQKLDQQNAFPNGIPNLPGTTTPDLRGMADTLVRLGAFEQALPLLQSGAQKEASVNFGKTLGAAFGGGQAAPAAAAPSAAPPVNSPPNIAPNPFWKPPDPERTSSEAPPSLSPIARTPSVKGSGDAGTNTIASIVSQFMPEELAGPAINATAAQLGVDPNAQLTPDQAARAAQLLRPGQSAPAPSPQPTPPPQPAPVAAPTTPAGLAQPAPTAGSTPMGAPSLGGNAISNALPALIQAASNPNLPPHLQKLAEGMLTKAMEDAKLSDEQRAYVWHLKQGGKEDFTTFMRQNKAAARNLINVDTRGESSFESEFGKKQADRWNTYIVEADKAEKRLVDVNSMREISTRLGSQGAAAGVKEAIGPYAEALGVNVDGLSDIQAYSAIMQRLAPQMRVPGSGSTSDIEFKGMLRALPGLSSHPEARTAILDTMEAMGRHDMAQGEIASRLATKEINRFQAEKELRALPDPMTKFREWRKANMNVYGPALSDGVHGRSQLGTGPASPPTAATPAAAAQGFGSPQDVKAAIAAGKLKSGDVFTDGNGVRRQVP